MKQGLDALELFEDEDFQLLDIQLLIPQGGTSTKKSIQALRAVAFRHKAHDYREVESRLKKLVGSFKDQRDKEMYRICYDNLTHILKYIIDHFNDEVDEVNRALETFISNLNRYDKPVPVVPCYFEDLNIAGMYFFSDSTRMQKNLIFLERLENSKVLL